LRPSGILFGGKLHAACDNHLPTQRQRFLNYTIPTSAVVIPTDATGPVNVILESSTDLVTWTAANPGTYGASTTKRFFRVRAVNQ